MHERTNLILLLSAALTVPSTAQEIPAPSAQDSVALEVVGAVIHVFADAGDAFWAGYNLATQPVVLYVPGRWSLLLNGPRSAEGFRAYPDHWPDLAVPAQLHWGPVEELVGQLYFNYAVGDLQTVAVPLPADVPAEFGPVRQFLFPFVVHEAFHQFQRSAFRTVETPPEATYPILDAENNALAALEMHILEEAVAAVEHQDTASARRHAEQFVGVRTTRWRRVGAAVRDLERAKELVEGTAKYVEVRSVGSLAASCRGPATDLSELCVQFAPLTEAAYVAQDFRSRLDSGALDPQDVPRNRIYPVGASLGLLLDYFDVAWKGAATHADTTFLLTDLLRRSVGTSDARTAELVQEAKERYAFDTILSRSRSLVDRYVSDYRAAIAQFEGRPGRRVTVQVPASGTSRSRSSSATKRWIMDQGQREFTEEFIVYTLRRPNEAFFLRVEQTGVLEELTEDGQRRVSFYVGEITRMEIDGSPTDPADLGDRSFRRLELEGAGFSVTASGSGSLGVTGNSLTVRLHRNEGDETRQETP